MTSIESKKKAKPKMVVAVLNGTAIYDCCDPDFKDWSAHGKQKTLPHGLVKESDLD